METHIATEQNVSVAPPQRTSIAAFLGIDLPVVEQPPAWGNRGQLPIFRGGTFEEHVDEWRLVDREAQDRTWKLAAIAASLERSSGGRSRGLRKLGQTAIQRFCKAVRIDRQTFHRLSSTYRKIADLASIPDATSFDPDLSFKHYEVAARLAGVDALEAIAQARQNGWSANELQRVLAGQRDKPQKRQRVSLTRTRERILKMMESWSEDERRQTVPLLRNLADEIEREVGPVPSVLEFLDACEEVNDDDPESAQGYGGDPQEAPF